MCRMLDESSDAQRVHGQARPHSLGSIIRRERRGDPPQAGGPRIARKRGEGSAEQMRQSKDAADRSREGHRMPTQRSSSRIRILIVDDHPVLREGLVGIIESQDDLEVVAEAATGKQGIEFFEKHLPDITLLDLGLPDVHGVEVIKALRAAHPDARIIVLTTYVGDVQALRALRAGAAGYLLKATLRRDLLNSIRAVHAGSHFVQPEVATELGQRAADPSLTDREIQVLKLIANGCSNKIVADRLGISEDTVKGHVRNILTKLNANDRTHAVTIALHRGYFEI